MKKVLQNRFGFLDADGDLKVGSALEEGATITIEDDDDAVSEDDPAEVPDDGAPAETADAYSGAAAPAPPPIDGAPAATFSPAPGGSSSLAPPPPRRPAGGSTTTGAGATPTTRTRPGASTTPVPVDDKLPLYDPRTTPVWGLVKRSTTMEGGVRTDHGYVEELSPANLNGVLIFSTERDQFELVDGAEATQITKTNVYGYARSLGIDLFGTNIQRHEFMEAIQEFAGDDPVAQLNAMYLLRSGHKSVLGARQYLDPTVLTATDDGTTAYVHNRINGMAVPPERRAQAITTYDKYAPNLTKQQRLLAMGSSAPQGIYRAVGSGVSGSLNAGNFGDALNSFGSAIGKPFELLGTVSQGLETGEGLVNRIIKWSGGFTREEKEALYKELEAKFKIEFRDFFENWEKFHAEKAEASAAAQNLAKMAGEDRKRYEGTEGKQAERDAIWEGKYTNDQTYVDLRTAEEDRLWKDIDKDIQTGKKG